MREKKNGKVIVVAIIVILYMCNLVFGNFIREIINLSSKSRDEYTYSDKVFSIISSLDNKELDKTIKDYAKSKGYKISITYVDTLDVINKLNTGDKYDAILMSNSIWLSMLDTSVVYTSNLRSTSITPVIFGVKKSKAEALGFTKEKVYTRDILEKVKSGALKFSMGNPLSTNSGASAYIEILNNLAGNPEVLKSENLKNENLRNELKQFFEGITRTSGDEDFLEKSFINGDYDAAFTYESSIININKKLAKEGKETLYAIYPVDGVAISDSPFVYIDNKNPKKKEIFLDIQEYLLSKDGQKILLEKGRRTWYGGVNNNAPKDIFNPNWGINTKDYITPIKYPSVAVLKEALNLYQLEFRKPVHVIFCLDYSGSMSGAGFEELKKAMEYILLKADVSIVFNERDIIDIVPFNDRIINQWSTTAGKTKEDLYRDISNQHVGGSTGLYPVSSYALNILKDEDEKYVSSIILMTDGQGNVGSFRDLKNDYERINMDIPIYAITFGNADERQLEEIVELTNGKVFNGKNNLLEAFKKVRGYN